MYLQIKPFGDWARAQRMVGSLGPTLNVALRQGQDRIGNKLLRIVRRHIEKQDLPSLQENSKIRPSKNHEERVLIDSGTYLANITKWRQDKALYVGVKAGVTEENGVEIAKIALWLELGTKHFVARPVWEPSIEELGGQEGMEAMVREIVLAKLIRDGWLPDE